MTHPTLKHAARLPGHNVTLTPQQGRARTFTKTARVIFSPDLALLTVQGFAYRVPVALFDEVRRAFDLQRVQA